MPKPVEIEVAGENATQVQFRPLRRAVRGRADFATAQTKNGQNLRERWPEPVPGQVLGIDADGKKYIREPLYERQYAAVAQRIKNRGFVIPEEREEIASETALTWIYWMRRMVDSGLARIVKGELPPVEELEPPARRKPRDDSRPRKSFILDEPAESTTEKLSDAMERLAANIAQSTAIMQRVLEKLGK